MKMIKFSSAAIGVVLFTALNVLLFSCKKNKQECITCTAVCQSATSSSDMKNCGSSSDNDSKEATFRDQNQGCTIDCKREKQ